METLRPVPRKGTPIRRDAILNSYPNKNLFQEGMNHCMRNWETKYTWSHSHNYYYSCNPHWE